MTKTNVPTNNLKAYQATVTENDVKNSCLELLARLGWPTIRVNSGAARSEYTNKKGQRKERFYSFATWQAPGFPRQSGGVSDILALEPPIGRLWLIEVKKPGEIKSTTQPQRDFQAAFEAAGGVAVVVDDVELLKAEIEKRSNQ